MDWIGEKKKGLCAGLWMNESPRAEIASCVVRHGKNGCDELFTCQVNTSGSMNGLDNCAVEEKLRLVPDVGDALFV